MSAKKNLTIAALAALLAVPAFSTNFVKASNLPGENMKASSPGYAEGISNLGGNTKTQPTHIGNIWSRNFHGNHYALNSKTGQAIINGVPVSGKQALYDINEGIGPNATDSSSNKSNNNFGSEYQNNYTNNDQLPQTNENNDVSEIAAIGDVALAAGASLVALSFAEKHRNLAKEDVATDTINTDSSKGHNNPNYSNKSSYDMIMSNTFAKLSNNLKNM